MESTNIIFTGKDQVEVRREPVDALQSQQVLLQTSCTLISTGTESICLQRNFAPGTHWDEWVKYPFSPGYSLVGKVVDTGSEVTAFKVGDRLAMLASHRQFVVISGSTSSAARLFPIPEALSDEEASWATIAYITQHGLRKAQIKPGEVVVVVGLGMLGQLVAQYARVAGAGEVIAIDMAPLRLAMAAAHGATHTLQMNAAEAVAAVSDLTDGQLADVVFDMTGHASVFAAALKLLRRFGRLVLIGDTGTPSEQHLTSDVIKRDLQIFGAHATNPPPQANDYTPWSQAAMVQLFYKYLQRGQMRVSDLITHRYLPTQAAEAYQMLATRRAEAMGVIFDFGSLPS